MKLSLINVSIPPGHLKLIDGHMAGPPRIMGVYPPNHPFVHRVFHDFHHPFWGTTKFWKYPYNPGGPSYWEGTGPYPMSNSWSLAPSPATSARDAQRCESEGSNDDMSALDR